MKVVRHVRTFSTLFLSFAFRAEQTNNNKKYILVTIKYNSIVFTSALDYISINKNYYTCRFCFFLNIKNFLGLAKKKWKQPVVKCLAKVFSFLHTIYRIIFVERCAEWKLVLRGSFLYYFFQRCFRPFLFLASRLFIKAGEKKWLKSRK